MKWKIGFKEVEFDPIAMEALSLEVKNISPHLLMRRTLWLQKQGAVRILETHSSTNGVQHCIYAVCPEFSNYKQKLDQLDAFEIWREYENKKVVK